MSDSNSTISHKNIRKQTTVFILIELLILGFLFRAAIFQGYTTTSITSFMIESGLNSQLHDNSRVFDRNNLMSGDNERQWNSFRCFFDKEFKKGNFPLWNQYVAKGMPFFAEEQTQASDPLALLLIYLFEPTDANVLFVFSIFFFAGLFSYLLAKELKFAWYTAYIIGISYMLCGPLVVWHMRPNSISSAFFPLLLLIYLKGVKRTSSSLYPIVAGPPIALMLLSGHMQLAVIALFCYEIFLFTHTYYCKISIKEKFFHLLKWNMVPGFVSFFLAAWKILPFLELTLQSSVITNGRGGMTPVTLEKIISFGIIGDIFHHFERYCNYLIKAVSPFLFGSPSSSNHLGKYFYKPLKSNFAESTIYVGVILLSFILFYYFQRFKRSSHSHSTEIKSMSLLFITTAGIYFGMPLFSIFKLFPILNLINMNRIVVFVCFSGIFLAGYAFEQFIAIQSKKNFSIYITIIVVMMIGLLIYNNTINTIKVPDYYRYHQTIFAIIGLFTIVAGLFHFKKMSQAVLILLSLGIITYDMLHFATDYIAFQPPTLLHPHNLRRSLVFDGLNKQFRFKSKSAFQSTFNLCYDNVIMHSTFSVLQPQIHQSLIDILNKNHKLKPLRHHGTYSSVTSQWLDTDSVKHIVIDNRFPSFIKKANNEDRYTLLFSDSDASLFLNTKVHNRFYMYDKVQYEDDYKKIARLIESNNFNRHTTLVVGKNATLQQSYNSPIPLNYEVTPQIIENDDIELQVAVNKEALLYISDLYYPGWIAHIGKKEVPIIRANYAFRAIEVPPGNHTITLAFRPLSFRIGSIISISGLCFLLFYFIFYLQSFFKKKEEYSLE